jgi:hypothetical protein
MERQMSKSVPIMMDLSEEKTYAENNAIAKVSEGLIEMGIPQEEAVDIAEDQLDYARVAVHMDAEQIFG